MNWNDVLDQWTVPRYEAWWRMTRGFPTVQAMVGRYLGYKAAETTEASSRETNEEAAARLMGTLFKM